MGRIVIVEECGSTNVEAADAARYSHGDAVMALRQTAGRGQRGHKWESLPGENLTFSIVVEPRAMPLADQFLLSEAVALGIVDALRGYGMEPRIKWTNDIYVGEGKTCGVLIENTVREGRLARAVVGIGLNVNQISFPEWLPNPTSMRLETGREFDVAEVARAVHAAVMKRCAVLDAAEGLSLKGNAVPAEEHYTNRGVPERRSYSEADCNLDIVDAYRPEGCSDMQAEYNALLYRRGEAHRYLIPGEGEVVGTIEGVALSGALRVTIDGRERSFLFREIEFVR